MSNRDLFRRIREFTGRIREISNSPHTGKTEDLDVQIALRNAEIIEAADAAAAAPGSAKPLQECMQKFLAGRGYEKSQMAVLPECTKEDLPRPFVNLGECVKDRGKLVVIQGYVPSKGAF